MLVHKPSSLSWEEAAGIPEVWITATQALYIVGQLDEGDKGTPGLKHAAQKTVLWHAGASSVVSLLLKLCLG